MGYKERQEQYRELYARKMQQRQWYRVTIDYEMHFPNDNWERMIHWLNTNCKGKYLVGWVPGSLSRFVDFESESDAPWFILKWK
jgi:hypothetical protein